jgi:hypothetical protein
MGLGALAGAIPAALRFSEGGKLSDALTSALLPSGLGATAGALAHTLLHGDAKRRAQRAVESLPEYSGEPRNLELGNPILAGLTGLHQQGRADVVRALEGEGVRPNHNPAMSGLDIGTLIPLTSVPSMIGHAVGSGAHFIEAYDRMSPAGVKAANSHTKRAATVAHMRAINADPALREYLDAAEQKRKRKTPGLKGIATAAGLAGTGAGLVYLGNSAISPTDRLKLQNLASLASKMDPDSMKLVTAEPGKDYRDSGQLFYDYVDRASEAAGVKVFGSPVQDLIEKLRKSFIFRGTPFDMARADPYQLHQTDNHYKDFTAGPLAAYLHQLNKHDESFYGSWAATENYIDPNTNAEAKQIEKVLDSTDKIPYLRRIRKALADTHEKHRETLGPFQKPLVPSVGDGTNKDLALMLNHFQKQKSPEMDTYRDFRRGLDKNLNSFLQEEGVVAPGGDAVSHMRDISTTLPHGKEMDLLRKFRGWVSVKDPEFAKTLGKVENKMAEGMTGPAQFYSFGGNLAAKLLQDLPRALGAGLIAGGVGLGGYWGVNKLLEKRREKELRKKRRMVTLALAGIGRPRAKAANSHVLQLP